MNEPLWQPSAVRVILLQYLELALEIHVLLHGGADDGRQARAKFGRECDTQHLTRVAFEQMMNDGCEQQCERDEEAEDRHMKPERLYSAETDVNREQRGDERTIRLIARERAEGCRISEEKWNVPQFANGCVIYDRVRVVEVKAVVKMVCIGRNEGGKK